MLKKILKTKNKNLIVKAENSLVSNNFLYKKLLGSLIKKGNKIAAERTLREALLQVSDRTKRPVYSIFNRIFRGLDTYVEVKKVTKRKNTHYIPFPVKNRRNEFLKVKWILDATKEDKRSVKFSDKLYVEILNLLYKKKKSKVLTQKKSINKDVLKHKANAHYRW